MLRRISNSPWCLRLTAYCFQLTACCFRLLNKVSTDMEQLKIWTFSGLFQGKFIDFQDPKSWIFRTFSGFLITLKYTCETRALLPPQLIKNPGGKVTICWWYRWSAKLGAFFMDFPSCGYPFPWKIPRHGGDIFHIFPRCGSWILDFHKSTL